MTEAGTRAVAARAPTYAEAVRQVWRALDPTGGVLEVVRAGTLAANSHNTQPWRFKVDGRRVSVVPDYTRRCPAVDPDDHHLFASLGCALENMVQAAPLLGFAAEPASLTISLERRPSSTNALAGAIVTRQCTRADYDGRSLSANDLAMLQAAGNHEGVVCLLITEGRRIDTVCDYVVAGNTAQMQDKAFMTELVAWIRFNDSMALARGDGLSSRVTGNPSLPAWLARPLLHFVMTPRGEADKITRQLRSSAGIAVFSAASDDKAGWIAAGRAYQRFALQAAALDIRHAFINQPVEVSALRPQLADYLGLGSKRPDLVVRFGRGSTMSYALRRPLEAVIERR